MLWQNIDFIVMIITPVWVMISKQGSKDFLKNIATKSSGNKEWATYLKNNFLRSFLEQACLVMNVFVTF